MNHIQTDTSDEALITAIRANMCDIFRHMGRSIPENAIENDRFTRWHTPVPHPWFSGVLSADPLTETDNAFVTDTIQYFREHNVNVFTWWMEPHLSPSHLEPILTAHGFGFDNDTPGMAVDLHHLNESAPQPDGLEIRIVQDDQSLRTWADIFTRGYGLPTDWTGIVFDTWLKLGLDLPMRNYLGFLNGVPLSTSSLFLGGGAAGIYCVATLPEARGKGIGAAITRQPLQDARAMGYRIGVLQSSSMGFNIYKGLGFRHLCQIENFYKMTA